MSTEFYVLQYMRLAEKFRKNLYTEEYIRNEAMIINAEKLDDTILCTVFVSFSLKNPYKTNIDTEEIMNAYRRELSKRNSVREESLGERTALCEFGLCKDGYIYASKGSYSGIAFKCTCENGKRLHKFFLTWKKEFLDCGYCLDNE